MHANTQIRRTIMLMPRAGTPNQSWRDVLDEVRELASRTGTGRSKLLRKLDELDLAMTSEIDTLDDARRRRIVGPRARVRTAIYTVEESPRGLALTERRDSKARPFKCPQEVYRAVMEAVAGSGDPQTFQQIKATAEERLKEPVADYGVRTPLRFWAVLGLVRHDQARFTRVGTKADFMRATRQAWALAHREQIEIEPD
jgi:hypothetical protein